MELNEVKEIWEKVKQEILNSIPESSHIWITLLEPVGLENDIFTLLSGQSMGICMIQQKYFKEVSDAFKKVLNKEIKFELIHDEKLAKRMAEKIKKGRNELNSLDEKQKIISNLSKLQSNSNLNLRFKFDNFVVGECNKFAYNLAKTVAEKPSEKYNPLFLYGGSGLGKTHLMQAIGHHIILNNPDNLRVKYAKTEDFINDFKRRFSKEGDDRKLMIKFRQKYFNVDVLLIDDIQLIENKKATIEEVFSLFDELYNKNKQIVISADRLPSELESLPDRLKTRFEMGVTVELLPPDIDTRINILKNLAKTDNIEINPEVIEYLAQAFSENVRELEGAYNKITAYANMSKEPITLNMAEKLFASRYKKKKITIDDILKTVAEVYEVKKSDMVGTSRIAKIASARQVAIYLARELTNESYMAIGEYFGGKKHSTVMYSYENVKEELKHNTKLVETVREVKQALRI